MPYFHVRVTRKSNRSHDALELDLSEDELHDRIVQPFLQAEAFMCGGKPILPSDVETIRINVTEESSKVLLPKIKIRRELERRKSSGIVIGAPSDEWYVTKEGEDVTRAFIKHPPREVEEKPKKLAETMSNNVFIVHGRDHEPMKELKAMLSEFGLSPIVLYEQAGASRTIVEKLEKYSDVGYAFVILTPDDIAGAREDFMSAMEGLIEGHLDLDDVFGDEINHRARQNVILEFGYFIGKLEKDGLHGRDRVCCLLKGDVESPSDMHGIVPLEFEKSISEVRNEIVRELRGAGYEIKV